MSKKPEIDQIFQNRLYDAKAEPPAFVWLNVEKALRRKRRRAIFWYLGGTLLLGSIGLFAWWNGSARPAQPANTPVSQAPIASAKQFPIGQIEAEPKTPTATSSQVSAPATASTKAGISITNSSTSPTARTSTKRVPSLPAQSQSASADHLSSKEKVVKLSDTDDLSLVKEAASLTANEPTQQQGNIALSSQDQSLLKTVALTPLSELEPEWLRTKQANAKIRQIKIARGKRIKKYKNCYDFASHSKVFLLDGYVGLSAARKDLRIGLPESTPYRDLREATERNSWAFNGGMRASMLFNQNFLVRAGLHYDQLTEIFEYQDPKFKKVTKNYVNGVFIDSTITYGSNFIKTYNRFGMLEVPLQAGFEMRKLRSGVSIQVGASFNVLFWKRGKIITPSDIPASIDPDDNAYNAYKSNLGVSVIGSVQWFYHIRPTLRVFAEPYYRHILRPVTISSHPLEQRYGIGGVRFGLTKILD